HGDVVLPLSLQRSSGTTELPADLTPFAGSSSIARQLTDSSTYRIVQSPPLELVQRAAAAGHTFAEPDDDGTVRADLAFTRVGSAAVPSLALAIAARASNLDLSAAVLGSDRKLAFGGHTVLLDRELRARPQYYR